MPTERYRATLRYPSDVFHAFAKLNHECRLAFFQTVMDPDCVASGEVGIRAVASNLIKTHDVLALLEANSINPDIVLHDLGEASTALLDGEKLAEALFRRLPEGGGFLSVPMSAHLRSAIDTLSAEVSAVPDESVTPSQLLLSFIRSDATLAHALSGAGLTAEMLGRAFP